MKHQGGSMMKGQRARPIGGKRAEARPEDAEYWQSRAERTRNQSRRYKQPAVRDHFAKIAGGYDELARRARETKSAVDKAVPEDSGHRDSQPPDEYGSTFDHSRVRDALEDDEVKEILRVSRRRSM